MKKLITSFILVALFLGLVNAEVVRAETGLPDEPQTLTELQMLGRLEGAGTHFELNSSDYLNITVDSSEPIKLVLESIPEMVTMYLESASGASSTNITLGGFMPLTTYHKYEDDHHNHVAFTTDVNGSYTYTQDLSKAHLVFIQPRSSTIYLSLSGWRDEYGRDPNVGTWDNSTRTATLTRDVTETIQIDSDGITLDGKRHTITGSDTGHGIFLSGRTGVTIKNVNVRYFSYGIRIYWSSGNTLTSNTVSNSYCGIYLYASGGNTLIDNTAISNTYGIHLVDSYGNTLTGNTMSCNKCNFRLIGNKDYCFDNSIDLSNMVDGKSIYYVKNANGQVYDGSTNAGTIYLINCNNVTIRRLTLTKNGAGAFLWNTRNSKVENITTTNNEYGIYLYLSSNNILTGNTVSNNSYGIALWTSKYNKIYRNNFINNKNQFYGYDCYSNIFNLEKPIGGNYWSNWISPDNDGDGFVDRPYNVGGGNVDNLPWTTQNGWEYDFSVSATPASRTVGRGQSATYNITIALIRGASKQVSLSVSGLPEGANASFTPQQGNPPFSSTLLVTTSLSTPLGTHRLTITGTSGTLIHSTNVDLIVVPTITFKVAGVDAPVTVNYTYDLTSGSITIPAGGQTSIAITYGSNITFIYMSPVSGGIGTQYVLVSTNPTSPLTNVVNDITVIGNYKTQYEITFSQSGLDSDATGTLVTATVTGGEPVGEYTFHAPAGGSIFVDEGATVSYIYLNPVTSSIAGKQYWLSNVTGPASPFTVTGQVTLTSNYIPLPLSKVTDSALRSFDIDPSTPDTQDFRLIFTQDPTNQSTYKLTASSPGQFYNIFYVGTSGDNVTLKITIPYPFVTQGSVPIHIYSRVAIGGSGCFTPSDELSEFSITGTSTTTPSGTLGISLNDYNSNAMGSFVMITVSGKVPASGLVYVTVHLDYGLKGTVGYTSNLEGDALIGNTNTIPNKNQYGFGVDGNMADTQIVENLNVFKRNPGFAGIVTDGQGNPVGGVVVQIYDPTGALIATVYTDQDGFYHYEYKHTGKAATFTVKLPSYNQQQSVTLKANGFVMVNFQIP